jgi:hypothetical protein
MRLTPFQHSIEYLNIGMVSSRGMAKIAPCIKATIIL